MMAQPPMMAPPSMAPPPAKSSTGLILGVVLGLAVLGGGGWFGYQKWKAGKEVPPVEQQAAQQPAAQTAPAPIPTPSEAPVQAAPVAAPVPVPAASKPAASIPPANKPRETRQVQTTQSCAHARCAAIQLRCPAGASRTSRTERAGATAGSGSRRRASSRPTTTATRAQGTPANPEAGIAAHSTASGATRARGALQRSDVRRADMVGKTGEGCDRPAGWRPRKPGNAEWRVARCSRDDRGGAERHRDCRRAITEQRLETIVAAQPERQAQRHHNSLETALKEELKCHAVLFAAHSSRMACAFAANADGSWRSHQRLLRLFQRGQFRRSRW